MVSPAGELLTRWTARIAVACFVAAILGRLAARHNRRPPPADCESKTRGWSCEPGVRWLWTIGCLVQLIHVACAFGFFHGWSHRAAYEHTAERTREVVGLHWGGGVYFNYAFTLAWVGDVLLAWRLRGGGRPPKFVRRMRWLIGVFMVFIVVNATIVFGPAFWRWLAAALLAVLLWRARLRRTASRHAERGW